MSARTVLMASALLVGLCLAAGAQDLDWTVWPEQEGGNGHEYAVVVATADWWTQDALAQAEGAYLATITSQAEEDFVTWLTAPYYHYKNYKNFWVGLVQDPLGEEPAEGWEWVTGEPTDLSSPNWGVNEPRDLAGGEEDFGGMNGLLGYMTDLAGSWALRAVLERQASAPPADETPPEISLNAPEPGVLAPPNGAIVAVSISGAAADAESALAEVTLVVDDEYDLLDSEQDLVLLDLLEEDGSFLIPLDLTAACNVADPDGRTYTISLQAVDVAGNVAGPITQVVVVPPDTTPPVVVLDSPEPSVIWPPNGEHTVLISGQAFDAETGISALSVFVEDEYGEYDAEYVLAPPDEAGGFSVEVVVGGSVTGRDGDGRVYLIWAVAVDGFGNETASDSVTATASNPARGRGQGNGGGNGNGNGNGNGPRK